MTGYNRSRNECTQFSGENKGGNSGSDQRSHVHFLVKGQEFDVIIKELSYNGDGVVKLEEYTPSFYQILMLMNL